jgi:mannose-6-phosphate isomerase-like protein (cupin superfamily)
MTKELDEVKTQIRTWGYRTWGYWEVLDLGTSQNGMCFKVKKLIIHPRKQISYQLHNHRNETWVIVSGHAQVHCNDKSFVAHAGDNFSFDEKEKHKVMNISETENLVAIEIQYGSIVSETDIVRL